MILRLVLSSYFLCFVTGNSWARRTNTPTTEPTTADYVSCEEESTESATEIHGQYLRNAEENPHQEENSPIIESSLELVPREGVAQEQDTVNESFESMKTQREMDVITRERGPSRYKMSTSRLDRNYNMDDANECFAPLSVKKIINGVLEHVKENPYDVDILLNEIRSEIDDESQLYWFKKNMKSDFLRSLLIQLEYQGGFKFESYPQCTAPLAKLAESAYKAYTDLEKHPICLQSMFGHKPGSDYVQKVPDLNILITTILSHMERYVQPESKTQKIEITVPEINLQEVKIVQPIVVESEPEHEIIPIQEVIVEPPQTEIHIPDEPEREYIMESPPSTQIPYIDPQILPHEAPMMPEYVMTERTPVLQMMSVPEPEYQPPQIIKEDYQPQTIVEMMPVPEPEYPTPEYPTPEYPTPETIMEEYQPQTVVQMVPMPEPDYSSPQIMEEEYQPQTVVEMPFPEPEYNPPKIKEEYHPQPVVDVMSMPEPEYSPPTIIEKEYQPESVVEIMSVPEMDYTPTKIIKEEYEPPSVIEVMSIPQPQYSSTKIINQPQKEIQIEPFSYEIYQPEPDTITIPAFIQTDSEIMPIPQHEPQNTIEEEIYDYEPEIFEIPAEVYSDIYYDQNEPIYIDSSPPIEEATLTSVIPMPKLIIESTAELHPQIVQTNIVNDILKIISTSNSIEPIIKILQQNQTVFKPKMYKILLALISALQQGEVDSYRFHELIYYLLQPQEKDVLTDEKTQFLLHLLLPDNGEQINFSNLDFIMTLIHASKQDPYSLHILDQIVPFLKPIKDGKVDHRAIEIILTLLDASKQILRPDQIDILFTLIRPNKKGRIRPKYLDIAVPLVHWDEISYLNPEYVNIIFSLLRPKFNGKIDVKAVEIIHEILAPKKTTFLTTRDINLIFMFLKTDVIGNIEAKRLDIVLFILKNITRAPRLMGALIKLLSNDIVHSKYIDILLYLKRRGLLSLQLLDALITVLKQERYGNVDQHIIDNISLLLEPYSDTQPQAVTEILQILGPTDYLSTSTSQLPDDMENLLYYVMNSDISPLEELQVLQEPTQPEILQMDYQMIAKIQKMLQKKQQKQLAAEQMINNYGFIELTYMLKHEKPLVYQPVYYVKYKIPVASFLSHVKTLATQSPQVNVDPTKLLQQLITDGNVSEISPGLKGYPKEDILKLTFKDGDLIEAKVLDDESLSLNEQIQLAHDLNSDITAEDILHQNEMNAAQYYPPPYDNIHSLPGIEDVVNLETRTNAGGGILPNIGSRGSIGSPVNRGKMGNLVNRGKLGSLANRGTIGNTGNMGAMGSMSNLGTMGNVGVTDNIGSLATMGNAGVANMAGMATMGGMANMGGMAAVGLANAGGQTNQGSYANMESFSNIGLANTASLGTAQSYGSYGSQAGYGGYGVLGGYGGLTGIEGVPPFGGVGAYGGWGGYGVGGYGAGGYGVGGYGSERYGGFGSPAPGYGTPPPGYGGMGYLRTENEESTETLQTFIPEESFTPFYLTKRRNIDTTVSSAEDETRRYLNVTDQDSNS